MPFDLINIGEASTAFNAAELTGLDSISAAAEAGITGDFTTDFAQGPDGLMGSIIPGADGVIDSAGGWYDVGYEQSFFGSDTQAALFEGGSVDSGFVSDYGIREELINVDAAASVDGGFAYDYNTREVLNATDAAASVDINATAAETARLDRFNEAGLPVSQPGIVDQITGRSALIADQIKAAGANAVSGLTTQFKAELPKLIAQAKQQAIGQAVGFATGAVKSTVAKALPGPLAAVANNVVDRAANSTASAFGATPISGAVDLTGGGGGDTANLSPGQVAALGGGGEITAAGLVDTAATNIRNYGNQLYSDTARGVQSFSANSVSSVTATGQNAEILGAVPTVAPATDQSAAETARLIAAAETLAKTQLAQRQQSVAIQRKFEANNGDWRMRISLAPGSDYLYNDPSMQGNGTNSILWPLKQTAGVIFPYTPKISTSYNANYSRADLTHSNYTNYFYQGSSVGEIAITAKFTAQDTLEAQYLLAVIHFFRSVTRMFYGQDAQRGAPPPLVFLTGFGEFQFQNHPCVISSFGYELPDNVDYIRARSLNVNGMDMLTRRQRPDAVPGDPISGAYKRLADLFSGQGVTKGAQSNSSPTALESPPSLGLNNPTYVPTSMDITLRLYPVQSRSQVSQQFSLKKFANGQLIAGGFW
jgi:hypothetical protein